MLTLRWFYDGTDKLQGLLYLREKDGIDKAHIE